MQPENNPEQKEIGFKQVDLKIEALGTSEATLNMHLVFDSPEIDMCKAYNQAIKAVTDQNRLGAFLQTGGQNQPGYHAWEMLGSNPTKEKLESLLPGIHQKAREIYHERKRLGF